MLTLCISFLLSIFASPIDYEISLAGNFGEPRPHHFHGGLDLTTQQVEGKRICSIGDGYVSRVTRGLYGFGNAVYVTHPEGVTSVYCHLKAFSPRIQKALKRYQYRHKSSLGDAYFTPLECPVSRGQLIAFSGNTGNSVAPHLHLEIHDTQSWAMLDPYEFLNDQIQDTVPPQAHAFMACPINDLIEREGVEEHSFFNRSSRKQTFGFSSHQLQQTFTAWGRVGFALWADDYMQQTYHHYGVRETILTVDGEERFHAVVDSIPVSMNRLVNSWGDYHHYIHYRTWYLRSFIEPGNKLPILHADSRRGIICFNEERDYRMEYILRDYKGNESRYSFTVRGEKPAQNALSSATINRKPSPSLARVFHWDQTNSFSIPGKLQLIVPYGLLANDMLLQPRTFSREHSFSDKYTFYPESYPLVTDAILRLRVRDKIGKGSTKKTAADPRKLYLCVNGKYAGGDYHDGWVTGKIRELGATVELVYDDTPPSIRPYSLSERMMVNVSDKQSGVASYTATIDGNFVAFDQQDKSTMTVCDLRETPIRKTGASHRLQFTAYDHCNNKCVYETSFVY